MKYASCLSGQLFDTEAELIEDARQHCSSSPKEILPSDLNTRMRALLSEGYMKELNHIIEQRCLTYFGNQKFWQTLQWPEHDAKDLASKAEFGFQGSRCPIVYDDMGNLDTTRRDLLQEFNLGIANLPEFAMEVLQKSTSWGTCSTDQLQTSDQQYFLANHLDSLQACSAVAVNPKSIPLHDVDSIVSNLRVQYTGLSPTGQLLQQGSMGEQPFDQGHTQSLMHQGHNLQHGLIYNDPNTGNTQHFDAMTATDDQMYGWTF